MDRKKTIRDEMAGIVRAAKTSSNHSALKKFCRRQTFYIPAITLILVVIVPLLFGRLAPTQNNYPKNLLQNEISRQPVGRIVTPSNGASTPREVTITCFTKNVPFDRPFVWAIVDVPSIGRCWPKKPKISPDGSCQISFYEGGPNKDFNVSLYAVGYGLNKMIDQWHKNGIFGGLPMIPPKYKLDSITLSLNGA